MNGSGCYTCPVKYCQTVKYRGSTCAAQRAYYGLEDPLTKGDMFREADDDSLANMLTDLFEKFLKVNSIGGRLNPNFKEQALQFLRSPAMKEK